MVKIKKAIFFDRDGTLIKNYTIKNNVPIAIRNLKDFCLTNNSFLVLEKLSKKFLLIVITNQPDVSRGKNSKKNVTQINNKLKKKLPLNYIITSFSANNKNFMRKPNPGMIYLAKKKYKINLKLSYVVGDTCKDILAGKRASCKTVLINKSYNKNSHCNPDYKINNLKQILNIIKF